MLCGEIIHEGPGCGCDLSLTLRENHEEEKFPGLRDDLPTLLGRDQGNNTRRYCLEYLVQFPIQSNNNTMRPRLIYNMTFPQIRLAQKNITNFERRNITQYLIFEGLDVVRQSTRLADAEIASLAEPSNGVGLWVWRCRQG
jgi:hypothetical protein